MLMSMISAPSPAAMRAPSDIHWVSQPAICTTCRPIPGASIRSRASRRPAASAAQAAISETTSPAPRRAANRRKGRIGHAGHRGEEHPVGERYVADLNCRSRQRLRDCVHKHAYIVGGYDFCLDFRQLFGRVQVLQCNIMKFAGQWRAAQSRHPIAATAARRIPGMQGRECGIRAPFNFHPWERWVRHCAAPRNEG